MGTADRFPLKGDVASATKVLKLGKVLGGKKEKAQLIVMGNDTREQMYHVAMATGILARNLVF